MKVGVDGVLIGAWTDVGKAKTVLDVGTGCGLIALMIAQRSPEAEVIGIDIDYDSVREARENVSMSPWHNRVSVIHGDFIDCSFLARERKFDLIVSNPPFFDSGVKDLITSRELARHQGCLSPSSLLLKSKSLLNPGGNISMIMPIDIFMNFQNDYESMGYSLIRKCLIRGNTDAPYKRILIQLQLCENSSSSTGVITEYLTLEHTRGIPTEEYRTLCEDFYLKF